MLVHAARVRAGGQFDESVFRAALALGQERAVTLGALVEQMDFLFADDAEFSIAADSWVRLVATERAGDVLDAARAHLAVCEWTLDGIDLRPTLDALGLKPRKAMPALYAAIEGQHAGLPLFDSIQLLGRERSLRRLEQASQRLARGT